MEFAFYHVEKREAERYFDSAIAGKENAEELKQLFQIAINSNHYMLFPYISTRTSDYRGYIDKWIEQYQALRAVSPYNYRAYSKTVTEDMSVVAIVATAFGIPKEKALQGLKSHAAFMSAEGVQGYLLEEYIAMECKNLGLLHCSGILKAIDFCLPDGSFLLQVKNKNNSESSPSMKTGARVSLWYRVTQKKSGGIVSYTTNWERLNCMIAAFSGRICSMSEEKFIMFIQDVVSKNPFILNCT